jgi:hypothetical protein
MSGLFYPPQILRHETRSHQRNGIVLFEKTYLLLEWARFSCAGRR